MLVYRAQNSPNDATSCTIRQTVQNLLTVVDAPMLLYKSPVSKHHLNRNIQGPLDCVSALMCRANLGLGPRCR